MSVSLDQLKAGLPMSKGMSAKRLGRESESTLHWPHFTKGPRPRSMLVIGCCGGDICHRNS